MVCKVLCAIAQTADHSKGDIKYFHKINLRIKMVRSSLLLKLDVHGYPGNGVNAHILTQEVYSWSQDSAHLSQDSASYQSIRRPQFLVNTDAEFVKEREYAQLVAHVVTQDPSGCP